MSFRNSLCCSWKWMFVGCGDFLPWLSQTQSPFFLSLAASCCVENFGLLLLCYRGRSVPLLCGARGKLKLNWSDRAAACHHVESAGHLSMFPADASWQTTALEIIKAWEETLACHLIPQNTSKMGFFFVFFLRIEAVFLGCSVTWCQLSDENVSLGLHFSNVCASIWIFFFLLEKKTKQNTFQTKYLRNVLTISLLNLIYFCSIIYMLPLESVHSTTSSI